MMYERIKSLFDSARNRYILIGSIVFLNLLCAGYILYQPSGAGYHRAVDSVERIERQQRENVELNRSVQRSIDRSADYSREAATRIERSQDYKRQINDRIGQSQSGLSEARSYLERNAELFDRIERANRQRQENNQTTTDAAQPISDGRGGGNHWSSDSSIER